MFTFLLYLVSQEANRLTDRANAASIQTQRAYAHFEMGSASKLISPDGKRVIGIRYQVNWKNSGSTPAKAATARINWHPYSDPLLDTFDFRDMPANTKQGETRHIVIGPGGTATLYADIRIDYLQRAMEGEHLYLWGWITYNDIFPNTPKRLTEFCMEMGDVRLAGANAITDPAVTVNVTPLPCPGSWNCYDEDCPDYAERVK